MNAWIPILVIIISLAGCSVQEQPPATSDLTPEVVPEDKKSDTIITGSGSCSTSVYDRESGDIEYLRCERFDGVFKCDCNGRVAWNDETMCRDALMDSCNVTEDVFGGCHQPTGDCWPDGNELRCQCKGSDDVFSSDQESCDIDLHNMCADSCNDAGNSCVPDPGVAGRYRCQCDDREVKVHAVVCEQAISDACNETACSSWTGFCEETTGSEAGYLCHCIDGSQDFIPMEEGTCGAALEGICGEPQERGCDDETDRGTKSCIEVSGSATQFDCSCFANCEFDDRIVSDMVSADSCESAMNDLCDFDEICSR